MKHLLTPLASVLTIVYAGAQAQAQEQPIGFEALAQFESLSTKTFGQVMQASNAWIKQQIGAFERGDQRYKRRLATLVYGDEAEAGLGMAFWLTDTTNAGVWDRAVRDEIGVSGYARIVALNSAFPAGAKFAAVYGGERRHDARRGVVTLNGVPSELGAVVARPRRQAELNQFGDKVRRQMFRFYEEFRKGGISQEMVGKFNRAYRIAGGCAIAGTDVLDSYPRFARYSAALNLMASTLAELGFPIR